MPKGALTLIHVPTQFCLMVRSLSNVYKPISANHLRRSLVTASALLTAKMNVKRLPQSGLRRSIKDLKSSPPTTQIACNAQGERPGPEPPCKNQ